MQTHKLVCSECHSVNNFNATTLQCSVCQEDLEYPFALDVSDENCIKHIQGNDIPVLVDFYSPMCGPCVAMAEDYDDAALGFALTVRFIKINADEFQKVAKEHRVSSLPTIIAFKDGQEINRISSQLSQAQLIQWAQELINI